MLIALISCLKQPHRLYKISTITHGFFVIIIIIAIGNLLQLSIMSKLFAMFTVRDSDSLELLLANTCDDIFYRDGDGAGSIPLLAIHIVILHLQLLWY